MTAQRKWAKLERVRLKNRLGNRCQKCGKKKWQKNLQFDCKEPQGDKHHRMGIVSRICFYRLQLKNGNLQLLCEPCHKIKTKEDLQREEKQPF